MNKLIASFVILGAIAFSAPAAFAQSASTTPMSGGQAAPIFFCNAVGLHTTADACTYVSLHVPAAWKVIMGAWRKATFGY